MKMVVSAILMLTAGVAAMAQGAATGGGHIFVVRHAEKVSETADALSEQGKARASCLALTLKDAKITAVFTSPVQRTQQTAAPTAEEFKVTVKTVKADDFTGIAATAKEAAKSGDVLIVGHSNTVPGIVKALADTDVMVGNSDYDRLFVIDGVGVAQLRFCPATGPEPESRMK